MKKFILIFVTLFSILSCNAQSGELKDLSNNSEMNYIFARLNKKTILFKELFNRGLFVTIFNISDSKATPDNFSESEEFLESFIVSIQPDGDYYEKSKLYKIEGLLNPKILEIKESKFPKFVIKIEYGEITKRRVKKVELQG